MSHLPGGDKFYEVTLKYYTSDDITPAIAHQRGLDEVARVTNAMQKVLYSIMLQILSERGGISAKLL